MQTVPTFPAICTLRRAARLTPALSLIGLSLSAPSALTARAEDSLPGGMAVVAPMHAVRSADTRSQSLPPKNNPVNTGPEVIDQILVLGNHALSQTAIVLAGGHKEGDPCTPQTLDEIRANLLRTGNFGLHSADPENAVKVRAKSEDASTGRCKVVIEVDENDVIAGVNITGTGPIKTAEIQSLLHLKRGMVYNPLQFRRDYEDIRERYNRLGYTVVPAESAGFDTKDNLNVALNVAHVTEIRIRSNRKTHPVVLLRAMQSKRNGYFNSQTLLQDRLRLLNLGLFEEVTIEPHEVGPGQVALDIKVREKKTGTVQGGFTYSATDGLIGTAQLSDDNFRGMGESIGLYGELGANLKHDGVELDYRKPWLDRRATGLGVQLYDRNTGNFANDLQNAVAPGATTQGGQYLQRHTGGSLTLSRPLGGALQGALTLRGEQTNTDPLSLAGVNTVMLQDGPVYTVGSALQRDTRDLIADPVRGGYQSLSLSVGHADLSPALPGTADPNSVFGSHSFAKSALEWRLYYSLAGPRRPNHPDEDKTSLALRVMAGNAVGKLPFAEQFFLGGADTLRGYKEDRFWGSHLLLSSIEIRQPLAHQFKLVGFVDVGEAWGGDYSNLTIAGFSQRSVQPHIGTGFGFRVGTPVGSLRLDLGFGDEGARAHFGFGSSF